ncbi:MAG: hypothetical protein ACE5GB_12660, partial [Acidimicrobiales bacterium]
HRVPRGAVAAPDTDMVALALTLVECSTGMVPDPDATWDTDPLVAIGVPRGLAIDLAAVLAEHRRPGASELAARLVRPEIELPSPARRARGVDSSPTVDFDPVGHPLGGA